MILAGQVIVGALSTINVAVIGVPVHPLATGVMVNVTVCCPGVLLIGIPLILPLPALGIPVTFTVLFLTQLNTVPLTFPLSTIGVIIVPEQTVCVEGAATAFGVGFTVMVNVIGVPVQVVPPLV